MGARIRVIGSVSGTTNESTLHRTRYRRVQISLAAPKKFHAAEGWSETMGVFMGSPGLSLRGAVEDIEEVSLTLLRLVQNVRQHRPFDAPQPRDEQVRSEGLIIRVCTLLYEDRLRTAAPKP